MTAGLKAAYLNDLINEFNLDLVFPRDLIRLIELKVHLYRKVEMYNIGSSKYVYVEFPKWLIEEVSDEKYKELRSFKLDELKDSKVQQENLLYDCGFDELYVASGTVERIKDHFSKDGRESSATKVEDYKNVSKILAIALQILEKELKEDSVFLNRKTNEIIMAKLVNTICNEMDGWNGVLKNRTSYDIDGPVGHLSKPTVSKIISWAKDYSKN